MSEAAILVVAAGFAAMGLAALAKPRDILAQFGVAVDTAPGRNEVRAVYGGFGVVVAGLLAVAALGDLSTAPGIVVAVAFALFGMAAGRVIGALVERPGGLHPIGTFFLIEVVAGALLLWAST